jgi:Mg2+-importing ATPase
MLRDFRFGPVCSTAFPYPNLNRAFWSQPIEQLLTELGAAATGLTTSEAERRLSVYGPNDATSVKRPDTLSRLMGRIRNPLVIVLLAASALSAATGDVASFIIVVTIVVLSVAMDFVQEQRAQNAIDTLREKVALCAQVMRDGRTITLAVTKLVPGDVVHLAAGDLIPADGRLIEARNLFVNQALLTGEPYPVEKCANQLLDTAVSLSQAVNAVFAGTSVISGAVSCWSAARVGQPV